MFARTAGLFVTACLVGAAGWDCRAEDAFLPSGRMALGANYWASYAATEMWRKWDAKAVDEDLRVLAANGFRVLRVFPNWADFQPIHACYLSADKFDQVNETRMFDSEEPLPDTPCGRAGVDERMVEHFEEFCDLAEKHGIRLIVPLLTGQMTFRNYIPPALANRNPFSDPYALMWEGRYLECMVSRLKAKKAIAAWESGNESRILGKSENAFHSEAWLRYVHQTIRCADPSRPVIGVDGLNISREDKWPSAMNAALSDYTTTHPRQEQTSQKGVANYMRGLLWNAWALDCKAMLWWCAYDQTGMTIAPYNWRQPCVELGIFRRDRTPYPAVDVVRKFVALQDALPFDALPKARTDPEGADGRRGAHHRRRRGALLLHPRAPGRHYAALREPRGETARREMLLPAQRARTRLPHDREVGGTEGEGARRRHALHFVERHVP